MTQLQFSFKDLVEELRSLRNIAQNDFIDPQSWGVLDKLEKDLIGIRGASSQNALQWKISRGWPLRTVATRGYKHGRARHRVWAEISSRWDIRPLGSSSPKNLGKRTLQLGGVASTRVDVYKVSSPKPSWIGSWRMEIAGHDPPGCFFHVQLGQDRNEPTFPQYLEVPRFPTFVPTPMLVVEFVLSELFVSGEPCWAQQISRGDTDQDSWRRIQQSRFATLLEWQAKEISMGQGVGSPWLNLKQAAPQEAAFIG